MMSSMFTQRGSSQQNSGVPPPQKITLDLIRKLYQGRHVVLSIFDNPTTITLKGKLVHVGESFHGVCGVLVLKQSSRVLIVRAKNPNISTKYKVKL